MDSEMLCSRISDPRVRLLNRISCCMLKEPNYYSSAEKRIVEMLDDLKEVAEIDPEFISQTAYYSRQVLNIRSTSNFLLAYAFSNKQASKHVGKYFRHSTNLPSDLLEVVEIYHIFHDTKAENRFQLSRKLQEAIRVKFNEFSLYQLGKYCSEGRRKRQVVKTKRAENERVKLEIATNEIRGQIEEIDAMSIEQKVQTDAFYTLQNLTVSLQKLDKKIEAANKIVNKKKGLSFKNLIRLCHIKQPAFNVMAILGKKYPRTEEEFNKSLLNEESQFDSSMSGNRMKVPVPKTWETMISEAGNKPEVWEELIKTKQLPFMAMIRNLRNILITGVDPETHKLVIDRISDPKAIENSKMFPFRFFSAYEAIKIDIDSLQKLHDGIEINPEEQIGQEPAGFRGGRGRGQIRGKPEKPKKQIIPKHVPTPELIEEYKNTLENAVKIATALNVPPIRGNTVIFCDVSGSMRTAISGGAGLGSIQTCMQIGILLGLMLRHVCENYKFCIFSSPLDSKCWREVEIQSENILENMQKVQQEAEHLSGGTDFPYDFLETMILDKYHIDNFVLFSDMMISPGRDEMICQHMISQQIYELKQKQRQDALDRYNPQAPSFEPAQQSQVSVASLNPESSSFEPIDQSIPEDQIDLPSASQYEYEMEEELSNRWTITSILKTYRQLVNQDMRFVTVDLAGHGGSLIGAELEDDFKNVLISGYSDSILKLIAELQKNQVDLVREAAAKLLGTK